MTKAAVLPLEESPRALRKLFRQRPIADLAVLLETLRTDAPRSVFRRLSLLGYVSSYNQNGRFYTLEEIPEFDVHGVWRYQGVFFSKYGTVNATIAHLVEVADSGHTHSELATILQVRVHNMLLELVKRGRIGRQLLDGLFVYVSTASGRAAAQMARRRQQAAAVAQPTPVAGQSVEIAVLLEVIHGARLIPAPAEIAARLACKDVQVSREQVESVFSKHGLKKTPPPRSRSSQR